MALYMAKTRFKDSTAAYHQVLSEALLINDVFSLGTEIFGLALEGLCSILPLALRRAVKV